MRTVSVSEARNHFSELISMVAYGSDLILIEKMKKPVAALVNIKELNMTKSATGANLPPSATAGTVKLSQKVNIRKVFKAIREPYDKQSLFGR